MLRQRYPQSCNKFGRELHGAKRMARVVRKTQHVTRPQSQSTPAVTFRRSTLQSCKPLSIGILLRIQAGVLQD
jgi:hypothetical protein